MKIIINEDERSRILKLYNLISEQNQTLSDFDKSKSSTERYEDILNKAKDWWIQWLTSPNTIKKFKNLNKEKFIQLRLNPDFILDEYKKIIDNIELKYYKKDNTGSRRDIAKAYVSRGEMNIINFNLDNNLNESDDEIERSLIHEIQHLLYYYFPLNPTEKSTNFRPDDNCLQKNIEFYNKVVLTNRDSPYEDVKKDIEDDVNSWFFEKKESIAKDLGINPTEVESYLRRFLDTAYDFDKWDKTYLHMHDSEYQSRLGEARKYFNVTLGGDITKKQIVDYLIGKSKPNRSVDYILSNWVAKEFPPLDVWLKELNSFVKTDVNKQKPSPTDSPYQPKNYYS